MIFLDEPTTGLDPQARRNLWDLIRSINHDEGKTVVLTTHYMEEAEELSHRVAIIDAGQIQALDTPSGLISGLATDHSVVFTSDRALVGNSLEELPGVTDVRQKSNGTHSYQLGTHSPKETVPALFQRYPHCSSWPPRAASTSTASPSTPQRSKTCSSTSQAANSATSQLFSKGFNQ